MNQPPVEPDPLETIPEPEFQRGKRFSVVWLIPLLAALIGGWLAVKAIRETGPTITIVFKSAEGLVPGKTEIKYKDVSVGKVRTIQLSEELSEVLVTAEMSRDVADYLTADTLFWIVRARVAVGEVSGISTLFSGAYIGMMPGSGGKIVHRFEGKEKPPAIFRDTPGRQFSLRADRLGSLDIGSPVYYRQVKVGRVTDADMAEDGTGVLLEVFIEAPYHHQVKRSSRFYNASGLNMRLGSDGIRVDTPSLASLLVGGISFFTAAGMSAEPPPTPIPMEKAKARSIMGKKYPVAAKASPPNPETQRRSMMLYSEFRVMANIMGRASLMIARLGSPRRICTPLVTGS